MKAAGFRYECPDNLSEALALLADDESDVVPLAGGQSLMPMMNFRVSQPDVLVDLSNLDELRGVERSSEIIRIGAMTRYAELESDAALLADVPLLARALPHIAHSAIRNRGTLGGSVALADPAAEMPAVLVALGAKIVVIGESGERKVPATEFFLGAYETDCAEGELVTAIEIAPFAPGQRTGFAEVARRHGDYAMAGLAISEREGRPQIAFFAIADRPIRGLASEEVLAADNTAIDAAISALADLDFEPDQNASIAMKRHLAGVVLRRAWEGITP